MNFKVNSLTSDKTALPFEYYSLPYCQPGEIVSSAENLGEVLRGDRIFNSLYQIQTRLDETCKVVCRVPPLTPAQAEKFAAAIEDEYRVNMILDNLPAAVATRVPDRAAPGGFHVRYERGFPVGFMAAEEGSALAKPYVNNHARFTILYNLDPDTDLARIVGFEVEPASRTHAYDAWEERAPSLTTCDAAGGSDDTLAAGISSSSPPQVVEAGREIVFTYDVVFRASPIRWASRWDTYLRAEDTEIHWFSVANSALVMLFLSGMVAMIMVRTLKRDISRYNELEALEEAQEETGWKLLHGDVFRPPARPGTLAALVGTGTQLLGAAATTMAFAVLGFLSPANRGGLMTATLVLFSLMGIAGGYEGARCARVFRSGDTAAGDWKTQTLRIALGFPGVAFATFFALNALAWGRGSSGAAPFGTLAALALMWFGVSLPLVFVGSYLGHKAPVPEPPTRTNKIPRQVPPPSASRAILGHPVAIALAGGALPFGAVFIELFFILTSMWLHQPYYLFGILALVLVILVVTCAEIAIVLCYFQLCAEDYHWWWRAFCAPAASGAYVFAYSAYYFFTALDITRAVPSVMYFAYMGLLSAAFALVTGTVGFLACHRFVRAIYASVKID